MILLQNLADAIFEGVKHDLLTEGSFTAFARICPIHGRLYEVEHAPQSRRCAGCLEALLDGTAPVGGNHGRRR